MRICKSVAIICTFILFSHNLRAAQAIRAVAEKMKEAVAQNEIAGAVTLVANKDKILHLDATGFADLTAQAPLSRARLFWIASMSKPVTGVAVLIMQDEGKLSIDEDRKSVV